VKHKVASSKTVTVVKVREEDLIAALGMDGQGFELTAANAEEMLGEGMLTLSFVQRRPGQQM
jgi:hypothetical protein